MSVIAVLFNDDHSCLADDPGRLAREEVTEVAQLLAAALSNRHDVHLVPTTAGFEFVPQLRALAPDLVVNLCESLAADSRGEMVVPALLDALGVPYTGSPALALGLALHKDRAKELLRAHGVPTPESAVCRTADDARACRVPFPAIVKPVREDASSGIDFDSVVRDEEALVRAVERVVRTFKQPALVERFIDGPEVYVPLFGNEPRLALPSTEVAFGAAFDGRPRILSYAAKWEEESSEFKDSTTGPCTQPAHVVEACVEVARRAFDALGCRDYGRVDMRLDADGQPYVIEVNPNCDLHPDAGFAKAAALAGLPFDALAHRLVDLALARATEHDFEQPHAHPPAPALRPHVAPQPRPADRHVHA